MITCIKVVNDKVVVVRDNVVQTFNYAATVELTAKRVTMRLLGASCLATKDPKRIVAKYTEAGNILGMSVSAYVYQIKGAAKRAYIDPIHHLIERFCLIPIHAINGRTKWIRDPNRVDFVNKHKVTIQSYLNDGNDHIAAYGMIVGDSKEAKSMLGKNLWKRICRTSKTRNDLIWAKVRYTDNNSLQSNLLASELKDVVRYYHSIPSTLLIRLDSRILSNSYEIHKEYGIDDLLMKVIRYIGGPLCKINPVEVENILTIVSDTATMKEGFNPKWSIKRMYNEHSTAIREQLARDYSKEPFNSTNFLTASYEGNNCTAELITSPFDVATHGKEQYHCVAGYVDSAYLGEYAIYKITDAEGVVSTLDINTTTTNGYRVTQHRLARNQNVTNTDALDLAEVVKKDVVKITKKHPEMVTKITTKPMTPYLEPNDYEEYPF